jgi:SAM-dependent methyltransferase
MQNCDDFIGVDLNANCIDTCTRRFAASARMHFYRNDGKSLDMVPNNSIDFIFSLDSLVHAEADVIGAYLAQFNRILRPEGVAFIHHSNYGAFAVGSTVMALGRVRGLRHLLWRFRLGGIQPNYHWRAESMSAVRFRSLCTQHGTRCVEQEMVNWGADFLNDCFSTVVRGDSLDWPQETRIIENFRFMEEAARIKST